ncbi:thiol:disulfide interchange protein DsbA/DsbL [Vibrio sp. YIC-376]|uniref:thiol:disulfide interchange protein DsbA/DsbL n=1 Tax=Vibrio sp. YIC-376 TaxID=3136162 RepID=UPI00402A98F0
MKKLFALFSTLLLAFTAHAAQFEEGKHYKVLDAEKATKPTVTEYFSFYCPHCYKFESLIANLKPALPEQARFEKVHVAFMGGNMAVPMAKSYATMVSLGVEDKMIPAMFAQIHQKREAPKDESELKRIFTDNGVDAKKFDAAYNSFAVNSMQKRFDQQFKESTLTGVPGLIVNNKYIVIPNEIRSYDEYNELVNYLLTL